MTGNRSASTRARTRWIAPIAIVALVGASATFGAVGRVGAPRATPGALDTGIHRALYTQAADSATSGTSDWWDWLLGGIFGDQAPAAPTVPDTPTAPDTPSASAGDATAGSIAARVAPATININTQLDGGAAAGTGMIITPSGEALTNNHVIRGATSIAVELADGSQRPASVLGYDVSRDVALIQIADVADLPTISTAGLASVSVGDPVVAMGNALGQGGAPSVVTGSVAALEQSMTATDERGRDPETLQHLIETDAPIQPGDSGGPLVNADGQVIGMDTAANVADRTTRTASQAFAIPIEDALSIARQIEAGKGSATVHIGERALLGVELDSTSASARLAGVASDSPAAQIGLQPGDTITAIDSTAVRSADQLSNALAPHRPGDRVRVTWRDASGNRQAASAVLVAGPPA